MPEPETVIRQRQFQVATGGVGVGISGSIGCNYFGQEPVAQMFGCLTAAGEVCGRNRYAVLTQYFFYHAFHVANIIVGPGVTSFASTCTEVLAGGASLSCNVFFVATGPVQPVKHHDRELFNGAVAQFPRKFRRKLGFAVHGGQNPDCIRNRENGVQNDFLI